MTLQTLLRQAEDSYFSKAAAEFLLQGLTNKRRYELYLDKTPVSQEIINEFRKLLVIRKPNMPVQYLLHKAYFLSYELYVDERVMIPRFETEDLVVKSTEKIKNPQIIIDVGTGSGAIAIALAHCFPDAKVMATDISSNALIVAEINIRKYGMSNQITLCYADLFPAVPHINKRVDLIVSSPPYIPDNEIASLSATIKDYEPCLALDGGKHGFELLERIIKEANERLSPNGLLALEIDPRQVDLIKNLAPSVEFEKDNQGLIRYAFIKYE